MDFLSIYFSLGLVILGSMILLWLLSLTLKNASIIEKTSEFIPWFHKQ